MTTLFFSQLIIRASVTQDHSSIQMKPPIPTLEIKLPMQTEGQREKGSEQPSIPLQPDVSSEEEEEDEDDWDTFQSFSSSINLAASDSKVESVAEEPTLTKNSLGSDINTTDYHSEKHSASESSDKMKEIVAEDNKETRKEEMIFANLDETNEVEKIGSSDKSQEYSTSQSCNPVKERTSEGHGETSKEVISDTLGDANEMEELHHNHQDIEEAVSTQENEGHALADLGPAKDTGELRAVNLAEDQQQSYDSHDDINEIQDSSSEPSSHEGISNSESHGEADDRTDSEKHQESGKAEG